MLISIRAFTMSARLAIPPQIAARDDGNGKRAKLITFDSPGAGTGMYQGTVPYGINPPGAIAGE